MRIVCGHCDKRHERCDCPASIRLREPLVGRHRDPEATVRRHARRSIARIAEMLQERGDEIVELAVQRSVAGQRMYGERMWKRTPDELDIETFEELADAVVYQGGRFDVAEALAGVSLDDDVIGTSA